VSRATDTSLRLYAVVCLVGFSAAVKPCLANLQGSKAGLPILSLVALYVENYERQMSVVIGQEDYRQRAFNPDHAGGRATHLAGRRRLFSDFAIVKLPTDDKRWVGVRDVLQVDGRNVPNRSGRLLALLQLPFGRAEAQWRELEEESSRFNIGGVRRTFNVPTFVLLFLRSDSQPRFEFDTPHSEGSDVVIDYREVGHPTFIRDEHGDDEPARGTVRANPATGAVVTTRLVVGLARSDVHAQIDTRFAFDAKLGLLVPVEMREQYSAPAGGRVEGVASYRNFQRFEVDSSWKPRQEKR
jgi:hypothetical protein